MRTNIVIDDELMDEAQRLTGLPSKRAVVEEGLRMLIAVKRQAGVRGLRGRIRWEGDLEQSRRGRAAEE